MAIPISNLSPTWANASNTYTGIGMNVTSTAYEANSSLLKLRRNSIDRFTVDPSGFVSLGSGAVRYSNTPITPSSSLTLKSGTSDYRIVAQDGSGRINMYWNALREAVSGVHRYIVSNEPASRYTTSVTGSNGASSGATYQWLTASGANAGETITWTTIATMYGGNTGYTWFSPRGTSSDFYIDYDGNVSISSLKVSNSSSYNQLKFDGTTLYATPSTSYGTATIPITIYNSGVGTSGATLNTDYALFPAASDTITLPVGTYFIKLRAVISVGSATATNLNLNLRGPASGGAVGSLSWDGFGGLSTAASSGTQTNITQTSYTYVSTALGTTIQVVTTTSTTNPRTYIFSGTGILKVTTAGTIVPSYQWSATIASVTLYADNYMILQQLDTQSAAAFGPIGCGWA